jgi:type IV pilus assembly protein PilM
MGLLTGTPDFFGLDLGTTAARIVQLKGAGPAKQLVRYAAAPIDSTTAASDSNADQQKILQVLRDLIASSQIATRNVAVGIPSHKVFTTVVDIDRLSPSELAKTIQLQADSLIPTPLSESKIDWAILGDSPKDKTKQEVLLTSVTNEFIEKQLDMLESIGLNVIAFEPDNLALARAMVAPEVTTPQVVLDVGFKTTDLVITMNGAPRLTRSIPTGVEAILRAASQNLSIDQKQAEQFVMKFGLAQNKLEGQIYQAIIGTVDIIVNEIDKSLKFFRSRYVNATLDRIVVTGAAASLPEFPLYIANRTSLKVEIGNAWRNVSYPKNQQNELLAVSSNFGVAAGLAERVE